MGLTFRTGALVDAIYTDSSNKVGIGTSTLTAGIPLSINVTTGNNCNVAFQENASDKWYLRNITSSNAFSFYSVSGSTEVMRLSSSGNVGIGISSLSSWANPTRALQLGDTASLFSYNNQTTDLANNLFFNGSDYAYMTTAFATFYRQNSFDGSHIWYTAPSGTANNAASISAKMTITNNGNVGIGTSSTSAKTEIRGNGNTAINSAGTLFVTTGGTATQAAEAGGQLTFGAWLNGDLSVPYPVAAIKGVSESSSTDVNKGALIFATMNNTTNAERMRITSGGGLCLGYTTDAGYQLRMSGYLYVGGNIVVAGDGTIGGLAGTGNRAVYSNASGQLTNSSSDKTLKTNVTTISYGLDSILNLKPISFNWIDDEKMGTQTEIGFIAQEVQEIIPELIGINNDETLSLDYPKMVAVLTKAIQELSAKVTALENR